MNMPSKRNALIKRLAFPFALLCALCLFVSSAEAKSYARLSKAARKNVEAAVLLFAKDIQTRKTGPDKVYELLTAFLQMNPRIMGATYASAPTAPDAAQWKGAPYVFKQADGQLLRKKLGSCIADYEGEAWFSRPMLTGKPQWSRPYFDALGAQIDMITYSVPIFGADGRAMGVVTGDVALQ